MVERAISWIKWAVGLVISTALITVSVLVFIDRKIDPLTEKLDMMNTRLTKVESSMSATSEKVDTFIGGGPRYSLRDRNADALVQNGVDARQNDRITQNTQDIIRLQQQIGD